VSDPGGLPTDAITCTGAGGISFCGVGENPQSGPLGAGLSITFRFDNIGGCSPAVTFTAASSDLSTAGPTPPIFVASFDMDGSCRVTGPDLVLFAADYGNIGRPCSDFNCSGKTDATDLTFFAGHYGH
jgi:hypothetical protein